MPGAYITSQQVEIYMNSRQQGNTQAVSAAKAGISERTGREIDSGRRSDPKKNERLWRTRHDPLFDVWESDLEPMLQKSPKLQPITLLEYLQDTYSPENYPDRILRTLQLRVKKWHATNGPNKEVMFLQQHEPGRQGLSDFTTLKDVQVTISGQPYSHLLYHFRLAYSRWSYIKVTQGGESFSALAEGLQEALQRLGGAPLEHRTDSLSAAFKNLSNSDKDDMTQRYEALCNTYS